MKKLLNLISIICILALPIQAQQVKVSGRVTDAQTGERLQGANIYLKQQKKGTTSDRQGNFELSVSGGEKWWSVRKFFNWSEAGEGVKHIDFTQKNGSDLF